MPSKNIVFIAQSIDGYIADKNRSIDWLQAVPNPENIDMGFENHMSRVDAIVMGRKTFETVCGFDMEWPYKVPVFVLSTSLTHIADTYKNKAQLINGTPLEIVKTLNHKGYSQLYIDGGKSIQSFLQAKLIDEMVITTFPILLGGGSPLFGVLANPIEFTLVKSEVFLNALVQTTYVLK